MTAVDHLFVLIFAVAVPIVGFFGFRRLLKQVENGAAFDRVDMYRNTAISHWVLFLLLLVLWGKAERPWSGLGISLA